MEAVSIKWPDPEFDKKIAGKPRLNRMVELARKHTLEGGAMAAGVYYRMILKDTSPPKTGVERLAHGEACVWYARWARTKNRYGEAADWYHQALNADPLAVDIYAEYVLKCLLPMGMVKEARIWAERAVKLDPKSSAALHLLGGVAHRAGDVEESIAAYDRRLELYPDDPDSALDRATIALDTADYETVRKMCGRVVGTPRYGDALHCLAMADYRENKHESAIELYDQAIAAGCYDPDLALWNKSLALHSIGRYAEGWAAHEHRGKQVTDAGMSAIMKRFLLPKWQGEPAPCRLHLHQEMGFGDVIAMARYAPILVEQGYDVRMEVNDSLVDLFKRSFPAVKVQPRAVDYPGAFGIAEFDYHCPMLSIPAVLKTEINTIPAAGLYLKPDPDLVAKYAGLLPAGKKIGLCWSSGIRDYGTWISIYGQRKSMHFNDIGPAMWNLTGEKNYHEFVSLQVGPERAQQQLWVTDVLPEKPNWDDTAALIDNLDLVITVDTAVAHLAGAMGKPTWLMMQQDGASWHFMSERSPWYPSIQIFRQKKPGDWSDVVDRVAKELGP